MVSMLEPARTLTGTLTYTNDLVLTNAQQGGELKLYQFEVPAGIASIEVRLEDRVGNPAMHLNSGVTDATLATARRAMLH